MELYQEKLKKNKSFLFACEGRPFTDDDENHATVDVLRAYLPANLVAEAESRIEAQKKGEQ